MVWIILVIAGLFEVGWAIGLKYTEGFTRLWPTIGTVLSMVISVGLLGVAMRSLPVGTAYSIWVGVGAVGTVALGVVLFGEAINSARLISVALIIAGIVGLKLTTASLEHVEPESTGFCRRLMNRNEALKAVVPAASVAALGSLVFATVVHFNSPDLLKPYGYILLGTWILVPPLWFIHEWAISASLPTVEQDRIKHFHDLVRNIWLAFVLVLGAIMGVENLLK